MKKPHLPMDSIKQVHKSLCNGLSALDLLDRCLERAKDVRHLNAFVSIMEKQSRMQAQTSAHRFAKGEPRSLLEGIPIAVKDNFCTKGHPTTCASRMLENFTPTYSATVVQRLEDRGAIILGKTNMDEFGMGNGTIDSIFGPTRNIWRCGLSYSLENLANDTGINVGPLSDDDWFVCGGSSGGSAVAVATGSVFGAISSDTGGSTRNPASYCGIVGFKPSYGLVSRYGLVPLVNSLDVPGILTRSVDDLALILNAISGPDPFDSTMLPEPVKPVEISDEPAISNLRVGIPMEYHCPGMSKEIIDAWGSVADAFEDGGAQVTEVSLPHTQYSAVCYSILNACEVASNMARYTGLFFGHRSTADGVERSTESLFASSRHFGFNDVVRGRILVGNYFLLRNNFEEYCDAAMKIRRLISDDFQNVWSSGIDVLLTPVTLSTAQPFSTFSLTDNRVHTAVQDFCTQPVNMAGIPAISIPVFLSESSSLPICIQLIGQFCDENRLLNVAKWLEKRVQFPRLILDEPISHLKLPGNGRATTKEVKLR